MTTLLRGLPISRKLTLIVLFTSVVVMLLMRGTFLAYEFVMFRSATVRQLSTLGEILAANSTAALAFENREDAREILSALQAERHVAAAALYDQHGQVFIGYPETLDLKTLPAAPGPAGYRFDHSTSPVSNPSPNAAEPSARFTSTSTPARWFTTGSLTR